MWEGLGGGFFFLFAFGGFLFGGGFGLDLAEADELDDDQVAGVADTPFGGFDDAGVAAVAILEVG